MGWAYSGTCYSTEAEAQWAHCLGSFPVQSLNAGVLVSYACEAPDVSSLQVTRAESAASAASAVTEYLSVSYPTCNENALVGGALTIGGFVEVWAWALSLVVMMYVLGVAVKQPLSMIGK